MSIWFGKSRTEFGKYLNGRGIKQRWLAEQTGVSETTISELASGKREAPTMKTANRIVKVLRQYDSEVSAEDFWG